MELHGGSAHAESVPGVTRFVLTFPVEKAVTGATLHAP
jgi:hypothetical protein